MTELKKIVLFCCTAAIIFSCKPELKNVALESDLDSASYALGVALTTNLKGQFDEINPIALAKALDDVYNDNETLFTMQEANMFLQNYLQSKLQVKGSQNKTEGDEFLASNKTTEGVVELESGLQYKIIKEGVGNSPTEVDKVKVHYIGKFIDGKPFDSSYDRGQPAVFQLNKVIRGWTEALQLMNPGSKWELYIPGKLAYGDKGNGTIGPDKTLIFEVELLEIVNE